MLKKLLPLAILSGVITLALAACGGDGSSSGAEPVATVDYAAVAAAAPTRVITPTPIPTRPAGETVGIQSQDGNKYEYIVRVVGGGGTTGPKSNTYGAVPMKFYPEEMTFKVGDVVTFTAIPTSDVKQQHTFSIKESWGTFVARMKYGKQGTTTVTFSEPGTWKYRCDIHTGEGMNGIITVTQ